MEVFIAKGHDETNDRLTLSDRAEHAVTRYLPPKFFVFFVFRIESV